MPPLASAGHVQASPAIGAGGIGSAPRVHALTFAPPAPRVHALTSTRSRLKGLQCLVFSSEKPSI